MKEYEDKPECDFVKDLVVAIVAEIERVSKRQRKAEQLTRWMQAWILLLFLSL